MALTPEEIEILKEGYASPFISVKEIGIQIGVSKDTVITYAKQLGLKKARKGNITPGQAKAIEDWDGVESINSFANRIGLAPEAVRKRLKKLGKDTKAFVKENPLYRPGKIEVTDEFLAELADPRLSAVDLAEKYGVTDVAIQRRRKRMFGKFKLQLDTQDRMTSIERKVQKLLDELDLAYFVHKTIHGWNVDFYIGQHKAIEVNGNFWHDTDRVKEKDERKLNQLASLGYSILTIQENDLQDIEEVKHAIQEFWVSPVSNDGAKYSVNASKSGVAHDSAANGESAEHRAKPEREGVETIESPRSNVE